MAASRIHLFAISEAQLAQPVRDRGLHLVGVILRVGSGDGQSLCNRTIGIGRGKAAVEARQSAAGVGGE